MISFIVVCTVERLFVIFVQPPQESPREESAPRLRLLMPPSLNCVPFMLINYYYLTIRIHHFSIKIFVSLWIKCVKKCLKHCIMNKIKCRLCIHKLYIIII